MQINVICTSNFSVDRSMPSLLYCFQHIYRTSSYCNSNSCRSFSLLNEIAKNKEKLIAIAIFKRAKTIEKAVKKSKKIVLKVKQYMILNAI